MVKKEKLVRFYTSEYEKSARKKKKNAEGKKTYQMRMKPLLDEMKLALHGKINHARLEDFHRRLRNIAYFAYRGDDRIAIMMIRDQLVPALVKLDLAEMRRSEEELITEKLIEHLYREMPTAICSKTLRSLCRQFSDNDILNQIMELVPSRPELEFQEALEMHRKFVLHIGPTNCGKTYQALERLKEAEQGVYLGPLRLLALEVYEKMKDQGIPTTMLTGEECIWEENSRIVSSTIEMLDAEQTYDVAVIDEAQMIADEDRGHSWTKAILGTLAKEIHICLSPAAEEVILHLLSLCDCEIEIHRYERKTKLVCDDTAFSFPEDIREGDALIVFNKRSVLDLAGRLEKEGIRTSVVYGSLPPEIRRRQIHLFNEKETKVVVSTDAIGMGLNLPVRRIVFMQTEKFDGTKKRPLKVSEILQIAGRAGRFGIYDTGYVTALGDEALTFIRDRFAEPDPAITRVSLGFPSVLLDLDEPLGTILEIWKSVEPEPPFEKISIDEIRFLYELAYRNRKDIDGFEDKHTLYRMLTCSIDIKNRDIVDLWLYYCQTYTADVRLMFPSPGLCKDQGLAKYETYYKMLDLYHQFSNRVGKLSDTERLEREREKTEDTIMRLLLKNKKDYIAKCKYCGRPLPLSSPYRVCENCFAGNPQRFRSIASAYMTEEDEEDLFGSFGKSEEKADEKKKRRRGGRRYHRGKRREES